MSDIVERLRALADLDSRSGEPLGKAMREAAVEIERLRAERAREDGVIDRDDTSPVARAIEAIWGTRCEDFEPGCPCCQAWAEYDQIIRLRSELEHARVALTDARRQIVEQFNRAFDAEAQLAALCPAIDDIADKIMKEGG